nr:hypothetical protein I308_03828 [Cryptococcus tetragattii IND107]
MTRTCLFACELWSSLRTWSIPITSKLLQIHFCLTLHLPPLYCHQPLHPWQLSLPRLGRPVTPHRLSHPLTVIFFPLAY